MDKRVDELIENLYKTVEELSKCKNIKYADFTFKVQDGKGISHEIIEKGKRK